MTLRIVLADDHSVVLQGLKALLTLEADFQVAALCTDGLEAVEAVKRHGPDVLVMDAAMPKCGGLEALRRLRDDDEQVPTVILAASLEDDTLLGLVKASVDGIVLKESAPAELVEAIRTVARGERWVGPELSGRAVELMGRDRAEPDHGLTPREKEVALHVAQGDSNKRVASRLGITESTVKLHLHNAFTKLDVSNRTQLSLLARERGWI